MTVMRVRRMAQVVLPAEVQRALNVQEGDYLEAEIVKDGVLLKPLGVVQRERAWQRYSRSGRAGDAATNRLRWRTMKPRRRR